MGLQDSTCYLAAGHINNRSQVPPAFVNLDIGDVAAQKQGVTLLVTLPATKRLIYLPRPTPQTGLGHAQHLAHLY